MLDRSWPADKGRGCGGSAVAFEDEALGVGVVDRPRVSGLLLLLLALRQRPSSPGLPELSLGSPGVVHLLLGGVCFRGTSPSSVFNVFRVPPEACSTPNRSLKMGEIREGISAPSVLPA